MSMNQYMFMGNMKDLKAKLFFYIVNGKIVEIKIKPIRGFYPLTGSKLKDFEVF
jgi:hypothetical protein